MENSRFKQEFWKGSPVFPVGTFPMEIRLTFTSFSCFVLVSGLLAQKLESSLARRDNTEILAKW